jgi:hypothetical protein
LLAAAGLVLILLNRFILSLGCTGERKEKARSAHRVR